MRFIFVVQGEGRGHLTQALTLEEMLLEEGHEVVEALVGKSKCRTLPAFFTRQLKATVRRFESPNFLPTPANRRNKIARSVMYNLVRTPVYLRSVLFIRERVKATKADVVINFYELLTGMAYLFFRPQVRQVCIGHQYLFLHTGFRFPKTSHFERMLLVLFTRLTAIGAECCLALSFVKMDDDKSGRIVVVPPLLRKEALVQKPYDGSYIHGYMVNSGFASQVIAWHTTHPDVPLRFFWDKKDVTEAIRVDDTLIFYPLDDHDFLRQMAGCRAYASTAGFESICEAMYMGKPILMVPAHIEQECNAFDAVSARAGVVSESFSLDSLLNFCDTYKSDGRFVQWVSDTSLILHQLTLQASPRRESFPCLRRGYVAVKACLSNMAGCLSRFSTSVWDGI